MKLIKTPFDGLLVIEPTVFEDKRGFFYEAYNRRSMKSFGIDIEFVQDNQSHSRRGVLRGLHYQNPPFAQTKLVRVLSGMIQDVVVDLRKSSPTFGKSYSIDLSAGNRLQLLVPRGFAHGFLVLSETADVIYKCDEYYNPQAEGGVIFNDPSLTIKWKSSLNDVIVSDKDRLLPRLAESDTFD